MRAKKKHVTDDISQCALCVWCSFLYSMSPIHRRKTFSDWLHVGVCVSQSRYSSNRHHCGQFCCCFGALYACACVRASIHFAICMFGCALKRRSVQPSQLYYYAYDYSWIDVTSSVRLSISLFI